MIARTNFEMLKEALLGEEGFIIKLRMLNGFDEIKYGEVCSILKEFAMECSNRDELPKKWVSLLVEISPSILNYIDNESYCETDENWNQKIWDAYDRIYNLILECCD